MAHVECNCQRCGARCRVASNRNPDAKMLRASAVPKGMCVNCATHDWLRNTYPVNMLLDESGPRILLYPHIRDQMRTIMEAGRADAKIDEINWNLIVENWDLPFPHKAKPSAQNPYDPQRDGPANRRRRREILSEEEQERQRRISELPMTLTSFDQLDVIEPGLGDDLRRALSRQGEGEPEPALEPEQKDAEEPPPMQKGLFS